MADSSRLEWFYDLGKMIRCMRRLEELLREMCCTAKSIGNAELKKKFAEGIVRIEVGNRIRSEPLPLIIF
jgi:superfamily II RNA helicase